MQLINCKIELKLKWIKYWVLSAAGNGNDNDKDNNFTFNIKDSKLYVSLYQQETIKNYQHILAKNLKSAYWNECKKSENKNTTNE